MSYQIIYDTADMCRSRKSKNRQNPLLMVCIFSIALIGFLRISGWWDTLWQNLIPGDPAVTTVAFQNMTENIQQGQSISDAIFVFCESVIQGAKLG